MLGWFREAIARASRSKRSLNCSAETLMRHFAPQPRVARAIHLAHPALAKERDDLVRPELCTNRQRHLRLVHFIPMRAASNCA